MPIPIVYVWESYPEYHATQQYSRCLGRILASLPRRFRRRLQRPMTRGVVLIGKSIAGAHAEMPPEAGYTRADREEMQQIGLEAVSASRHGLQVLKQQGLGDRANILAALELLERVAYGLRTRPLPD